MIEPIHPYESLVDHGSGLYTLDGVDGTVVERDGKRLFLQGFGERI
jgi:hypothetical protein